MMQYLSKKWLKLFNVRDKVKGLFSGRFTAVLSRLSTPEPSLELQPGKELNQHFSPRRRTLMTMFLGLLTGAGSLFSSSAVQAVVPGKVRVSNLRLIPSRPVVKKLTRISAVIETSGTGRINVPWSLQMDGRNLTSGLQRNHTAGRPFTITGAWNATPGSHTVTVRVDPANKLREPANLRKDNIRNLRFKVTTESGTGTTTSPGRTPSTPTTAFKVHLTTFRIEPSKPKPGERCTLIAKITTSGSGTVDVPWEFLLSNRKLSAGTQRRVKAGRSFEVRAIWQAKAGLHNFLAKVDPRNQNRESSREIMDNARGFSLRVQASAANNTHQDTTNRTQRGTASDDQLDEDIDKELKISQFSISPTRPKAGETANLRLRIQGPRNQELKVRWQIYHGNDILKKGSARLLSGKAHTINQPWRVEPGNHRFRAVIQPNLPGYKATWNNGRNQRPLSLSVQQPADWPEWGQAALRGAIEGANLWISQAKLTNVRVNGPVATGGKLRGPDFTGRIRDHMKQSGVPQNIAQKFAQGVWLAWRDWQNGVSVPALPWYPAFAAFPGKKAPPMPNVPSPLAALASKSLVKLTPPLLTRSIKKRLGKLADDPLATTAIDVFASEFMVHFSGWLARTQVMLVMGSGNVPSFAPPYVPVGPVLNGRASSKAGFLSNGGKF